MHTETAFLDSSAADLWTLLPRTARASGQALLDLRGVGKVYGSGGRAAAALRGLSLRVAAGELVALTGPAGSGKSTALNVIGCLEAPDSGQYRFRGVRVDRLSQSARVLLRRFFVGFVPRGFNPLSLTRVLEAVEQPLLHVPSSTATRQAAGAALEAVGLPCFEPCRLADLSPGARQRVAIARALITRPSLLLMDEPGGAADAPHSGEIVELLATLARERGIAVLVALRDPHAAACAGRVLRLEGGRVAGDSWVAGASARQP